MTVHLVSGYVPITVRHRSEAEYHRLGAHLIALPVKSSIYMSTIDECWMGHAIAGKDYKPRHGHDEGKNTMEYHIVQHQKTTWMLKAAEEHPEDDVFVWMDYGIFHMDGFTRERVVDFLHACKVEKKIAIPGAWPKGELGGPCWRFNGSILICHRKHLARLDESVRVVAMAHAELTGEVIWEVNTWDIIETMSHLPINWYGATHDATMLTAYRGPR